MSDQLGLSIDLYDYFDPFVDLSFYLHPQISQRNTDYLLKAVNSPRDINTPSSYESSWDGTYHLCFGLCIVSISFVSTGDEIRDTISKYATRSILDRNELQYIQSAALMVCNHCLLCIDRGFHFFLRYDRVQSREDCR